MFLDLMTMLNASKHYGLSEEVEILKGYYNKPVTLKQRINKIIRKIQYYNGRRK